MGLGLTYTETSTHTCVDSSQGFDAGLPKFEMEMNQNRDGGRDCDGLCVLSSYCRSEGALVQAPGGQLDIVEEHRALLLHTRRSHFSLFDITALPILGRRLDASRYPAQ